MLAQVGACGNVFGYNYSAAPVQGEGETNLNDGWTPDDISLHGHYAYMNLFESNSVVEAGIGDYWGPSGPGNTFFRNTIRHESDFQGLYLQDYSHGQNLIGNVLEAGSSNIIDIHSSCQNILVHGNSVGGTVSWDPNIDDHQLPFSYYLTEKPVFLEDKSWPLMGSDITGTNTLPAQDRFEGGQYIPVAVPRPIVYESTPAYLNYNWGYITYRLPADVSARLYIYNSQGKTVVMRKLAGASGRLALKYENGSALEPGIYIIKLTIGDHGYTGKINLF
jgi:hypothetical protein